MAHPTVTLKPSHHRYAAPPDQTLLDAALAAGINLPYGCRNGACGTCKSRIIEGRVDYGAAEEWALPPSERETGAVLMCCARALTDLVIEANEARAERDIPVKKLPVRIESLERAAADVMVMRLKLPATERLQFLPGQYIDILLTDGARRAFSLASTPQDEGFLELHIRLIDKGAFTQRVFSELKERDILRIEGPHGNFFLRESTKPAILLAGGTGFAPIKALIEHTLHSALERPLTLYWGARERSGLYRDALAQGWAAQYAQFRYVPVLSAPTAADAWSGRTGLAHEAVLADYRDSGMAGVQVYACGAPAMIEAAQRDFLALGLPPEEFFADAFSFAAPQKAVP